MKQGVTSILIILFFVFCVGQTMAQRANGLAIEGLVTVQEGSSEGAIIQMYRDGRRLDNYGIGADGKYNVELNWNHKWELVFEHEGNFSQKIVVETAVPRDVLNTDPKFPPFPVNINLFTEIPGIDNSFAENTILKIFYSPSVDNFVKELYYNDAQIERLINQAIAQAQQIDENADFMARLTRAELAELRKEYNELLEQAGKEYSNEEFLEALDGYKAASKIFPSEQFPKDRIAEINDLLGLIMAAEELDAAMLARFNKLVREGDLHLGNRQLPEAKKSYNRALSIKPLDQYVNDQLKKLAEMQEQQRLAGNYQNLIEQGDQAIDELLFNEALGLFNQALEIRPNEQYPKTKIAEINGLLAEQRKNQEDQKSYNDAMSEGERMFSKQFFDRALTSFENALSYKPGDIKATRRIEDSKKEMKRILDRMEFDKFIAAADKAYKKEDYPDALSNYEQALELVPDEPRTKKRVEEISEILYALNSFNEFVSQADKQFDAQSYATAKSLYEKANELKAGDKHVQERIAEIAQLIAQQGVDEQYAQVIEQADNLLAQKNYEDARSQYTEALQIKPREQYPKDKLDEIASTLTELARLDRQYNDLIAEGDRLFGREDYTDAKSTFAQAAQLKPEESYPPEMMDKIDGLVAENERLAREEAEAEAARLAAIQAEKDKNYNDAIARADELFAAENYEEARNEYSTALDIKPEEAYAQQRIDEIGKVLAQLSAAQKAYEDAVAEADREFRGESWEAAIAAYNTAKQAKTDETYPDEQLAKIDSIVTTRERLAREEAEAEAARLAAIQAEKDKNYNGAIARADELFAAENYEGARNEYRAALDIKPEEAYAQQCIDEIGNVLAQLSAAQKAYEDAVAEADREFRGESWEAAIAAYNTAKQAKTDETYPDEQLSKIDSIVSTRERLAREEAEAEAARLAAIQAEKDKNYNGAIARADELFAAENYEEARNEYRAALDIKPEEAYAQQRIDEIGNVLTQLSAAQKAYEDAVAEADREFRSESWEAAIAAYNTAKQAKADETYPDEQLAKIDSIVSTRERLAREEAEAEAARLAAIQAEKDKNYNDVIARADGLFADENYEESRNEYRAALDIKPEEAYAQQRIDEIGNVLAKLSAAQKAYEEAVAEADRKFRSESWDAAIAAYNTAKQVKADETYPDEQLAKIDSIVSTRERLAREEAEAEAARLAAIQAEKDKNYNDAIARADELFAAENYEEARNEYRAALDIKPEEAYAQLRIDEIGNVLAQLSAAQKAYEDAVAEADREFRSESWDAAIAAYNTAKQAKTDETYPDEQLAKIDSIVTTRERIAREEAEAEAARLAAIQAEKDKNYNDAIARADELFAAEDYEEARNEYRAAQNIKPEELYPPQRIDEIDRILRELAAAQAAQAELDRKYANLIMQADRFFAANSYTPSKENYTEALALKPEETYPKDKIAEIDRILEQRAIDEKYRSVIVVADGHFRTQVYDDARLQYEIALGVKPNEEYPKEQIRKIDAIRENERQQIAQEQANAEDLARRRNQIAQLEEELDEQRILEESGLNALYDQIIKKADGSFDIELYNVSRAWYYKARDLKPEEAYPPRRIAEINRILGDMMLSERDREYQRFIDLADESFRNNELAVARGWYNQALSQKDTENYPKEQLREIERRVAERVAGQSQQQFENFKTTANSAFEAGNYNVARFYYRKALELRSDDAEVKAKLQEIEALR
jgi:tetratricopeptide (TPR) repeat protein